MTITGIFLPYAEGMLSSVAVLAYEGVSTFGLGVTAEVFGCGGTLGCPGTTL